MLSFEDFKDLMRRRFRGKEFNGVAALFTGN